MERATIEECLGKGMHIVYNSKGEKKVLFHDKVIKALPIELENIEVSLITKTLTDFAMKLYNRNYEVSQSLHNEESISESIETGKAITGINVLTTHKNKNSPASIVELSIDEAKNYNKHLFIDRISNLNHFEFTCFCHVIFKMHQFFIIHEGCWCTDALVLPEEVFNELEVLDYPFSNHEINIEECKVYNGSRYIYDPADVVQRSVDKNRYDKMKFIRLIEILTFNQFQAFCKDVFCLMRGTYISFCAATKIGAPITEALKKHKNYFFTITYPFYPADGLLL